LHTPPQDWLSRLTAADAIYISHNHSDHLNLHTLRRLAEERADVPVYVPDFGNRFLYQFDARGRTHRVTAIPFGQWIQLADDARFSILPDGSGRCDSGFLFEYRGHRIVNAVDCANLCDGDLPTPVDILLSSFAGGASGYPVCMDRNSTIQKKIQKLITQRRTPGNPSRSAIRPKRPTAHLHPFCFVFL
jgi:CMP-N-acetylneuraminate monooxygenase